MFKRGLWGVVLVFMFASARGQTSRGDSLGVPAHTRVPVVSVPEDTTGAAKDSVEKASLTQRAKSRQKDFMPVPKKALMFSLLTPGLGGGQIYNRDYWKLPFVYLGYGTSFYFIDLNLKRYGDFADAYKKFYYLDKEGDGDNYGKLRPDVSEVEVYIRSQKRMRSLNIDQVRRIKDTYRRWRDWSFFAATAVYALAAIEANVAAHLKTFDMSDDLTLRVEPSLVKPGVREPVPGLRVVLTLK